MLGGLCVGAFALARREARSRIQSQPFVWAGILAVLALGFLGQVGLAPESWVSIEVLERGVGAVLVIAAAGAAWYAGRLRGHAEALIGSPAMTVDEAIQALRNGDAESRLGVFIGRLTADVAVLSPSGIPAAIYRAEIRADGGAEIGAFIAHEQGAPQIGYLRGVAMKAVVPLQRAELLAQTEVRRARRNGGVPGALSHEPAIRDGAPCRVFGKLSSGPLPGCYEVRPAGTKLLVASGIDLVEVGRSFGRRSWAFYGAAALLCCIAAFLLGR
jgi:hypothetical protein